MNYRACLCCDNSVPAQKYFCRQCHKNFSDSIQSRLLCFEFSKKPLTCALQYNDFSNKLILQMKRQPLGHLLQDHLKILDSFIDYYGANFSTAPIDFIQAVPSHPLRSLYQCDLSKIVASKLSHKIKKPCVEHLQYKSWWLPSQKQLPARLRKNLASKRICTTINERAERQSILLVDDVITSGATIEHCARKLQSVGFNVMGYFCLAKKIQLPERFSEDFWPISTYSPE